MLKYTSGKPFIRNWELKMLKVKISTLLVVTILWACKHKTIKPIQQNACDMTEETLNCKNLAESDSFKLIDGDVIKYSDFPSVHLIYNTHTKSFCTGTFIKPNLMITAGHCINPDQAKNGIAVVKPKVVGNKITSFLVEAWSKDFIMNPKYIETVNHYGSASFQAFLLDVGFIVFADNTSEQYRELNFSPIPSGETIELVGFGKSSLQKQLDLRKRTGTNEIAEEIYHRGFIEIEQVIDYWKVDEEKGDTGILPGDSGGPMLYDDKIIGIVSGFSFKRRFIFWKRDIRGIFAELAWKDNLDFIQSTVSQFGQKNQ